MKSPWHGFIANFDIRLDSETLSGEKNSKTKTKTLLMVSKMVQQGKVPITKSDHLSLTVGMYMVD